MEVITDADYAHAKKICKDFEIKNSGEHHDLYDKSHILLLADVFEIKICVLKYTNLILQDFFQLMDYHVKQL